MIQVISRAVEILHTLEAHSEGLTLNEIAHRVELPRSTVHRIIRSLEEELLVEKVSNYGGYRIGPALLRIASSGPAWLARHLHGYLRNLSHALNETVDLSIRSGDHVYFVDQIPGHQRLQAISGIGVSLPLYCTAPGKAMLAAMSPDEVAAIVGQSARRYTSSTITTLPKLERDLKRTRRTGVAFDREEHHKGICAVGTLVTNQLGISTAISVPVPSERYAKNEKKIVTQLLECRDQIERSLQVPSRR